MAIQIQELIEKIQNEGVGEADAKAKKIISDAEAQAATLLATAQNQAQTYLTQAKAEIQRFEAASRESLIQASRNTLLLLSQSLQNLLASILSREVQRATRDDALVEIIKSLVSSWKTNASQEGLEILLPPDQLAKLEQASMTWLKDACAAGVVLRPYQGIKAGFRVGDGKTAAYYDFSAVELAELLSQHVNTRLSDIINESAKDGI